MRRRLRQTVFMPVHAAASAARTAQLGPALEDHLADRPSVRPNLWASIWRGGGNNLSCKGEERVFSDGVTPSLPHVLGRVEPLHRLCLALLVRNTAVDVCAPLLHRHGQE